MTWNVYELIVQSFEQVRSCANIFALCFNYFDINSKWHTVMWVRDADAQYTPQNDCDADIVKFCLPSLDDFRVRQRELSIKLRNKMEEKINIRQIWAHFLHSTELNDTVVCLHTLFTECHWTVRNRYVPLRAYGKTCWLGAEKRFSARDTSRVVAVLP